LRLDRQFTVQRQYQHVVIGQMRQRRLRLCDFTLARQEHQQVAAMLAQRILDAAAQLRQFGFLAA
jgi:hypothetical protein